MRMRRIFIDPDVPHGDLLHLRGPEAHYLLRVLRLREGDEVNAFDGRGWSCRAVMVKAGKGVATLSLFKPNHATKPLKAFAVAQAILKAPAMDTVVQMCTELGASAIIGFHTARSVPRSTGASAVHQKLARWRKLTIEACRQCRRDFLPEIRLLPRLEDLGAFIREFDHAMVASLAEGSSPLATLLCHGRVSQSGKLLLIVGPEGDFSEEELARLRGFGAVPCGLSDAVLRAETAAGAGAAILGQHFLSERL
jgi:16S rRNA (uracil1498-N3)-methyltransferase